MASSTALLICTAVCATLATASASKPPCSSTDNADDCAALMAFGKALGYASWKKNTHWMEDKTVCGWKGVTCSDGTSGRVTGLRLKDNNLVGAIPEDIGKLTQLETLDLSGGRPANYIGCSGNDFKNSSLPKSLFTLTGLTQVNLEYTCTGGTLEGFGNLAKLTNLSLHGNYISGSMPVDLGNLKDIVILKLGRNPITGQLPHYTTFSKVVQFNCNFCALSGPFPDMFNDMPSLQITYWDGNGFTGSLPPSIVNATRVSRLSFNINQFTGKIPPGLCKIPAGDGDDTPDVSHDCRIGADTDLAAYQADKYPWIIRGKGNMYDCPVPACAVHGSCNKTGGTKVVNPVSPVQCD